MNEFDDMVSEWKKQPIPTPQNSANAVAGIAKKRVKNSRQKHVGTILVLGITLVVLVAFALLTKGNSNYIAKGIQLMIGALCIRIGIEWLSVMLLNKLDITKGTTEYLKMLTSFYKTRRKIHGTFTYIIFGLYVAGFCMILPIFKATLSTGFFTYICVSGAVVLGVLIFYIRKKTKQELDQLKEAMDEVVEISDAFEEK
jgi:hypothetical protein